MDLSFEPYTEIRPPQINKYQELETKENYMAFL